MGSCERRNRSLIIFTDATAPTCPVTVICLRVSVEAPAGLPWDRPCPGFAHYLPGEKRAAWSLSALVALHFPGWARSPRRPSRRARFRPALHQVRGARHGPGPSRRPSSRLRRAWPPGDSRFRSRSWRELREPRRHHAKPAGVVEAASASPMIQLAAFWGPRLHWSRPRRSPRYPARGEHARIIGRSPKAERTWPACGVARAARPWHSSIHSRESTSGGRSGSGKYR